MIHIGSDAGVLGEVEIGVYSVSKAAVHMLVERCSRSRAAGAGCDRT